MKQRIYTLTLLLMAFALGAMAQLRLPAIISDHMVIQRGEPVHVWGWAAQGQKVTATLAGHKATVRTGKDGRWSLYLPAISAAGPHSLRASRPARESGTVNLAVVQTTPSIRARGASAHRPGMARGCQ